MNDRFDRDVSEDATVGADIAATDGTRREQARQLAPGVRTVGFRTSHWSIVESYQVADADDPRARELFEMMRETLRQSGMFDMCLAGMVLTGGASLREVGPRRPGRNLMPTRPVDLAAN